MKILLWIILIPIIFAVLSRVLSILLVFATFIVLGVIAIFKTLFKSQIFMLFIILSSFTMMSCSNNNKYPQIAYIHDTIYLSNIDTSELRKELVSQYGIGYYQGYCDADDIKYNSTEFFAAFKETDRKISRANFQAGVSFDYLLTTGSPETTSVGTMSIPKAIFENQTK